MSLCMSVRERVRERGRDKSCSWTQLANTNCATRYLAKQADRKASQVATVCSLLSRIALLLALAMSKGENTQGQREKEQNVLRRLLGSYSRWSTG